MDENIYLLPDGEIRHRMGYRIKQRRLRQNLTQATLADQAQISVSTLKKIEGGDIALFDSFMRVLRILGELDVLSPLIEEEELSPNRYYQFMQTQKGKQRKRATSTAPNNEEKEDSTW